MTNHFGAPGGDLTFKFTIRDEGVSVDVDGTVEWTADVAIGQCTATAGAHGAVEIGWDGNSIDYAGSLGVDGHVRCYALGQKVASAGFDVSGEIDGNVVRYHLPHIGQVSLPLPR